MAGVNLPVGGAGGKLATVGLLAGLGLYGLSEGLYNVEGGHRAIVFSRIGGIKDQVVTFLNQLDLIFKFVWCCISSWCWCLQLNSLVLLLLCAIN